MHLYGFIIGISLVTAVNLIYWMLNKQIDFNEKCFNKITLSVVVGGIVGARLWHVVTDFYLYQDNLVQAFIVTNGGLSIFGAILFGLLSGLLVSTSCPKGFFLKFLDATAFALPIAQAIGRLGNLVNQELYGLPVNEHYLLKLYIDPVHRLAKYQDYAYYHPLFLYEAVLLLLFSTTLFYLYFYNFKVLKLPKIGSGALFTYYILYYLVIRFILDFIRIDKVMVNSILGVNQAIILGVIGVVVVSLIKKW